MHSRPLVGLKVDIENCGFDVFVNGGLITSNLMGTPSHESLPINHFVRSGENELMVYVYEDATEPTCDVSVAVTLGDADNEAAKPRSLLTLAYSAKALASGDPGRGSSPAGRFDTHRGERSDKGELVVGPVKIDHLPGRAAHIRTAARSFSLPVPFPEWVFFKGQPVPRWWEFKDDKEREPIYLEIQKAYGELQAMLAKKDVTGFLDACEERSREIDLAYYKKPGETRARLRKDLESAMSDAKLKLIPVVKPPGKHWQYTVGSSGKLIELTTGKRASPIIRFEMTDDTQFSMVFPVVFRKEGGRYIVTR